MSDIKPGIAEIIGRMGSQVTTNYVQIFAFKELLIEKGILTKEEIDKKFGELWEEKSKVIYDYIEGVDEK